MTHPTVPKKVGLDMRWGSRSSQQGAQFWISEDTLRQEHVKSDPGT